MARPPVPGTPPLFDPTLPPSSSLLFYLFAERAVTTSRRGTKAPLAPVRVATDQLACALLAVAFWQLRESGLVRLELSRDARPRRSGTHLQVIRAAEGPGGQRDGIEGGILDILAPRSLSTRTPGWEAMPRWIKGWTARTEQGYAELLSRPTLGGRPNPLHDAGGAPRPAPGTVAEVVARWFGFPMRSPEQAPIRWTEREAVAKGYLAVVDAGRNPIVALFLGATTQVPQREKIAPLEPSFVRLFARWQAFKANEAPLFDQLERDVVAGIDERRDTSDSGSSS